MESNRDGGRIEYPVFLIKKDGTNQKIGKITMNYPSPPSKSYSMINANSSSVQQVKNFNMYILDYIQKDIKEEILDLAHIQTFNVFFVDDIIGIVFKKLKTRKGNIYFVFQKSSRGSRFLCYFIEIENHLSNVFGSKFTYNLKEAKEDINKALPYLLERLNKFASIYSVFQPNTHNKYNLNRNFGI